MIVCVCHNVNEGAISAAAQGGARSVDDIARVTGAGTDCRGCRATIEAVLAQGTACMNPTCAGCPRASSAQREPV